MSSTFYGFEIAKTGLRYNQKALDVTAHNIANVETEGYSRQRIESSSIDPYVTQTLVAPLTNALVGGGVSIDYIQQIRNQFLDRQYRNEASLMGEWTVKAEALSYIEKLLQEPSDIGVMSIIDRFFVGMQELASNVGSKDLRTNFLQQAITLTDTINYYGSQLNQIQDEQDYAFTTSVKQVNEYIDKILAYNKSIARYELGGNVANDLRDKRNVLLDKLSEYANITYVENKVGNELRLTVNMTYFDENGDRQEVVLIDHDQANKLEMYNKPGSDYHYIRVDGIDMDNLESGKLKGYLDIRDGNTDEVKSIQYYKDKLDYFANSLVNGINEIHRKGWTIPQGGGSSMTGIDFFDPSGIDALSIKVNDEIIKDVFKIAASDAEVVGSINSGNNKIILELINLREQAAIGGSDNFEAYMSSYIAELGIDTAYASTMRDNEEALLNSVMEQRMSISGVSIDEEMANMVKFEKSYQAAARILTALDEMLDVLINRVGLVGR
jgi:flagellar hook-associated protein 1 FlgK